MNFKTLKKYIFQSIIYLLEIILVYLLINSIFFYFCPTDNFFELDRFLGIYALYQLFIYSTLKLANDAKKDSYFTLKSKNEEALLCIEYWSNDEEIYSHFSNILKNHIALLVHSSVFNDDIIKNYYYDLIQNIDNKDSFLIKMEICHINHSLSLLNQEFLLSILLRIIKSSTPQHVKNYINRKN